MRGVSGKVVWLKLLLLDQLDVRMVECVHLGERAYGVAHPLDNLLWRWVAVPVVRKALVAGL